MGSPEWPIGCILLTLGMSACGLEVAEYDSDQVICSQGLSKCTMEVEFPLAGPRSDAVVITDLKLQAKLCCKGEAQCALCLVIDTELDIHPNIDMEDEDHSGHEEEDNDNIEKTRNLRASVKVCYRTPHWPACKRVEFIVNPAALPQQNKAQLSLVITSPDGVSFSSTVSAYAQPTNPSNLQRNIEVPCLDQVCSPDLQERIEECEVPTLNPILNWTRNQVELQVVGRSERLYPNVCIQSEEDGKCEAWNETTIPLYSVTSCMCLQAWWNRGNMRSRRSLRCPFINHDIFQRTIWQNVSVAQGQMSRYGAMLSWNVSAPCRLEAEVWPCHRTAGLGENNCKEIKGFRQQLSNGTWRQNNKRRWEKSGAFENINLECSPCMMVKVKGMEKGLGPFCLNDTDRWRWSLLVVSMVLLVCLAVLILYLFHDRVKTWVWSWHRVQTVGGRGHVVLLSPPDVESIVSELVCKLGSLLRDQAFSVSVDQWSRTQQCSLGPLPWLHSQLLKLDSVGGQVMLVMTQNAWERAKGWSQQCKEAQEKGDDTRGLPQILSPYSDVFTASLAIIQAHKQQGRAGEQFLLVDFESHPAQPASGDRSLPEPFQGLRLFHLPSQTQALLTELTVGRGRRGSGRRRQTEGAKGRLNGWAAGTQERLDQERAPPHKCLSVEKNWEVTPLKQHPSEACHTPHLQFPPCSRPPVPF